MKKSCLILLSLLLPLFAPAATPPFSLFPIEHYSQNIETWVNPERPDYTTPLISTRIQQHYARDFYNHLYATDANALSPWSKAHLEKTVAEWGGALAMAKGAWVDFRATASAKSKERLYGENFRPYDAKWFDAMADKMDWAQFRKPFVFSARNRAIVVRNTAVRALPTREVGFYDYRLTGQGYPFDNFQTSATWLGRPVYVLGQSRDRAWVFIVSASFVGWVEADAIARVSGDFLRAWQKAAGRQLVAVTHTKTAIANHVGVFQQAAYVGSVFPLFGQTRTHWAVLLPYRDSNGMARIRYGYIQKSNAVRFPLSLTPQHFAGLIKTLEGRPYGWGGLYFYNDCSQELRSLYTPFGIWLPRNSAAQGALKGARIVDETAATPEERIAYLSRYGKPWLTFVDVGGHVFLYIGNYPNPHSPQHEPMVMTYQNMWGLRSPDGDARSVVGESVFFPLLLSYPDDPGFVSQAGRKIFRVVFLGLNSN